MVYNITSIPAIADPTIWFIIAGVGVLALFLAIVFKIVVGGKK
jgi:hypothetical protein